MLPSGNVCIRLFNAIRTQSVSPTLHCGKDETVNEQINDTNKQAKNCKLKKITVHNLIHMKM